MENHRKFPSLFPRLTSFCVADSLRGNAIPAPPPPPIFNHVDHRNAAEAKRGPEAPPEGDGSEREREEHRGYDESHVHEGE